MLALMLTTAAGISETTILDLVILVIATCVIWYITPKLPQPAQWVVYGLCVLVALLVVLSVLGLWQPQRSPG